MATSEKSGFSNVAMEQGYDPNKYGMNPPAQYGGENPPPYVVQPQHGAQSLPPITPYNPYGAPTMIVTAQPLRETGTPPSTSGSLIVSILCIFFCLGAWPFAVVAIVFNRKAKGQVDLGQYTAAKSSLRTCLIFIGVTVFLGIIAWVIFAIRLKATLDYIDNHNRYYG